MTSLTLLMNSVGIKTGWRVIQGAPDVFSITKTMHTFHGDSVHEAFLSALQRGVLSLEECPCLPQNF